MTSNPSFLARAESVILGSREFWPTGRLSVSQGMLAAKLPARVGELVEVVGSNGEIHLTEVIGFSDQHVSLMPFSHNAQLQQGDQVRGTGSSMRVPVGMELLGRVINAIGTPVDGGPQLKSVRRVPIETRAPDPLKRMPVKEVFETGQRSIDGLLTIGKGQRVGLFAGSGVGKSTLLGQISRHSDAEVNVVCLVGERGREVLPFLKESLGEEGVKKSIIIVSTSNEPALTRVRAAETAVTIADWFRKQGKDVFLMLDSITRFAMAQRDLGLMLGEPPTTRGYTPSVFQRLGLMLEQLGNSDRGSITALLTVLVDGDDLNDPIADSVRSILDGHIVLDRGLANSGHFPAIDILSSASRVFTDLADNDHAQSALAVRRSIAKYREVIDLVQVGAYRKGVVAETDQAIDRYPDVCRFLQQSLNEANSMGETLAKLRSLAKLLNTSGVDQRGEG